MNNYSVLTLDDDPSFNVLIEKKLEAQNFDVISTLNVESFIHKLKERSWDLIMVDVHLNEGQYTGISLVKFLRKKIKIKQPIFVLSSEDNHVLIQEALLNGATDYLTKPFNMKMFTIKNSRYIQSNLAYDLVKSRAIVPEHLRECYISSDFTPVSITESMLLLNGIQFFSKGTKVVLKNSFLSKELGINELKLTVIESNKNSKDDYIISFSYGNEEDVDLIKNYILQKFKHLA